MIITFLTHRHSLKRNFYHKKCLLLVDLFTPSIDHIRKQTFVGKKILQSFIHLTLNVFLIFNFKHVFGEVGRKFVMEHVFRMGRDFKAQLCLWTPPCPINLTILIYKFRLGLNPHITSSIAAKVVLTITPLEWLVTMHIIFGKNTGGKKI